MFLSLNLRRLGEMNPVRVVVVKSSNIVMEETDKLRSSLWKLYHLQMVKIVVGLFIVLQTGSVETMTFSKVLTLAL